MTCQWADASKQEKNSEVIPQDSVKKKSVVENYYEHNKGDSSKSESLGTVSKGSLKNGKLLPFEGENFHYFDTVSYLAGRAFLNDQLLASVLEYYSELAYTYPNRHFCIMECSNKHGGEIAPHRTHQNGLSIDFMIPLAKQNQPYYALDSLGKNHYLLNFNNSGQYDKDTSVSIDFDLVAAQILTLDKVARLHGLKISKVIIKTEFKDELFATENGNRLKNSNIYLVQSLTPLINSLHDDHFHVDFELFNGAK